MCIRDRECGEIAADAEVAAQYRASVANIWNHELSAGGADPADGVRMWHASHTTSSWVSHTTSTTRLWLSEFSSGSVAGEIELPLQKAVLVRGSTVTIDARPCLGISSSTYTPVTLDRLMRLAGV